MSNKYWTKVHEKSGWSAGEGIRGKYASKFNVTISRNNNVPPPDPEEEAKLFEIINNFFKENREQALQAANLTDSDLDKDGV